MSLTRWSASYIEFILALLILFSNVQTRCILLIWLLYSVVRSCSTKFRINGHYSKTAIANL